MIIDHNNKEIERTELHKTIWRIANDLRGSVDGWDFKSYVLGMLFYRFISEHLVDFINEEEHKAGEIEFNYLDISDKDAENIRQDMIDERGFFILPSELFQNIKITCKNNKNLNEDLDRIFKNIVSTSKSAESEAAFQGLFDDLDVNSNKLGSSVPEKCKKLSKLIIAIGDLPLKQKFKDNTNDLFGDAYEYLMQMYASSAGKSGGEYYTPQEVSELLAKITIVGKKEVNKVYDPACGSGSLLLKFAKILGNENVRNGFYGQEINLTTYNLCRINMFLHNIDYENFSITHGNTLTNPLHQADEPFEAIVSNPPYSTKWIGDEDPSLINDPRFAPAGVLAPKSKADLAFTMHILSYLAENGTASIVEFPGVLYRGGAEQKIRKYLIENNFVDAVIQLPPDLFFGTTIGTCIIVLKKAKTENKTLFIDASKEFVRQGNKNKLSAKNQEKILNAYIVRENIPHFAEIVHNEKIAENDYSLSISSYIEAEDTKEIINIKELNAEIEEIVQKQSELRLSIDAIIAELEGNLEDK